MHVMNIVNQINEAYGSDQPFSHYYYDKFFDEDLYKLLIENLPNPCLYEPLMHRDAIVGEYDSTRYRFILNLDTLKDCHSVWTEIYNNLASKEYRQSVFTKLQTDLLKRFGTLDIKCEATVVLYKDFAGYKISPHPDHRTKVVTTQYYLPIDTSLEETGTCLYEKNGNEFTIHRKMKFLPRYGYGFAVSKNSWHGVEPVGDIKQERNSLLVIFYEKENNQKKKK